MKNLKLSFALLIAILAVSVAVVTKAHSFGKKRITGCFDNIQIVNCSVTPQSLAGQTCTAVPNLLNARPYVQSVGSAINPTDECVGTPTFFCCAELIETANTCAPLINLGDGLKRYQVDAATIQCKIQP